MKKKLKDTKGITLIALVLTIIILLILAGVTIATLTGENGILSQAQNAKKVTEYATAEEKVKVEVMGSYGTNGNLELSKLVENLGHVGTVTKATFPVEVTVDGKAFTVIDTGVVEKAESRPTVTSLTVTLENGNAVPEEKVEEGTKLIINLTASIEGGAITTISPSIPYTTNGTEKSKIFTITGSVDGESYSIEYTVQLSDYYIVPNPEAGKTTKSHNRTLSGSTDTTQMTYKNPVIPQGFSAVDTTVAKWQYEDETTLDEVKGWNNGLVIKDDIDNEFVWVPCTTETVQSNSLIVQYSKKYDYPTSISSPSSSNIYDSDDYTSSTGDGKTYKAIPITETSQIETYGGFYVARYEAGLLNAPDNPNTNNTYSSLPVSKYGCRVWNFVDFTHSYVAAQKMINSSSYGNNKSGLITGTQWDTIMKWMEKSNIGVGGTTGTQNWGTYKTITYNGDGQYFTRGNSKEGWQIGIFSHSAYTNNTSIDSSHLAHYHASGVNFESGYQKNIADLGGNLSEYTSELYYTRKKWCVHRGGTAYDGGDDYPVSYRDTASVQSTSFAYGFRVVIYIQE